MGTSPSCQATPAPATPAPATSPQVEGRPPGTLTIGLLTARARPTSSSQDQLLPLLPALAPFLPRGALQRGSVVAVGPRKVGCVGISDAVKTGGDTTLAFALLAAASSASWCAAVGVADLGVVALAQLGVNLDHLAVVPCPGSRWAEVAGVLLDGMDVVLVSPPGPIRPGLARRLTARARERRAVLVVLPREGRWPEGPDAWLTVETAAWEGVEEGYGHLCGRRATVLATGRRAATRPVRAGLWLPTPSGGVASLPLATDQIRHAQIRQTQRDRDRDRDR
jgi:hypothetical protein